jgi:hypothetical protein
MTTPPKGDFVGVPLNPVGRQATEAWDPARDETTGEACKAYGVGGIMRRPGRLRISWQDDETLKVEADAGTQTRTLAFRAPRGPGGDWQGVSIASWDRSDSVMGRGGIFPGVQSGADHRRGRGAAARVEAGSRLRGHDIRLADALEALFCPEATVHAEHSPGDGSHA